MGVGLDKSDEVESELYSDHMFERMVRCLDDCTGMDSSWKKKNNLPYMMCGYSHSHHTMFSLVCVSIT